MKLYHINGWNINFENNRSRSVETLAWVSIPNRHDGENYSKIMHQPNCGNIFSGFILMVEVASKCNPRGTLVKDNGFPHDSASLALKTRAPKALFDEAFAFLEKETDWLLVEDLPANYQPPVRQLTLSCEEGKEGKGKKEGERVEDGLPKEAAFWNANCGTLPKVVNISDERKKRLNSRRQDRFWVANFEAAVKRVALSEFCNGKNDRGWKSDFDWMLQDNVVTKIMEGKYDNRKPLGQRPARDLDVWPGDPRFSLTNPPPESAPEGIKIGFKNWATKRRQQKEKESVK